jgi:general secretion pathway protein D
MNMIHRLLLACLLLMPAVMAYSAPAHDDLITIGADTSFPDAMNVIETRLKADTGRIIMDFSNYTGPIGIQINQIHWKAAFISILTANGMIYNETPKAWVVRPSPTAEEMKAQEEPPKAVVPDEVMIEVTIFEADETALKEVGVDWSTLTDGKVEISSNVYGGTRVTSDIFSLSATKSFDTSSGSVDVNALLKVFEANEMGHVIARPQVVVASGEEAEMQDGTNFSIKTKDEAGNITDKFFDTGTIVKCTPTVVEADSVKYIHLKAYVERSSAEPSAVSTTEKISKTSTIKLMYDGEETVISGLSNKEKSTIRHGIPILKDLPWWVLGIRYLTGYNKESTTTKEIIVILKASILPELKSRKMQRNDSENQIDHLRKQLPIMEDKLTK